MIMSTDMSTEITENKPIELKYSEVRASQAVQGRPVRIRCECGINYSLPMVGSGDVGKVYRFVCSWQGGLSHGCGRRYNVKIDKV